MVEKKVDESWKQRVEEEKSKPVEDQKPAAEKGPRPPLPEADFMLFIAGLVHQTLIHLGEVENPITKKKEGDIEQAKYSIDLLQVLEDKTKGNLTDDEQKYLSSALYDLRMRYVQASR